MARSAAPQQTATPLAARWRILGFLGVAQLMLILDVTVVAIALPHMEVDLGLSREAVAWTVSAYTLTFGGLLLLGGRIADLAGAKKVVLAGLAIFTIASLVTGLAGSGAVLLGGRVAQGVGAALLSPSALSLVVTMFQGDERNRALGIWSALGGGGAALGVLVGGLLTAGPGWPWVFYTNVPLGLVLFITLATMLPASTTPSNRRPGLDVLGAFLVTASTGTLIYGLIAAGEQGWLSVSTGAFALAAAVGYVGFVLWQRSAASPLMDAALLVRRPVVTGIFLIAMATALMIAMFFLGTFYFQQALGLGALQTGLLFLPVALATMVGANVTGKILGAVGGRILAVAGFVVAAAGLALPALALGVLPAAIGIAVGGAGTGALFVVASATALGNVEPHQAGVASGIVSTFHEFGAAFGAAATSSAAAASLIGTTLVGYTHGFTAAAVVAVTGALITAALVPGRRAG
jgi:EmrB/QacA subfamily drug resistance transporter